MWRWISRLWCGTEHTLELLRSWTFSFIDQLCVAGKNKQRNLGCLFTSHSFFREFYFSILTVSKQSAQSFLHEELFMPESIQPPLRDIFSCYFCLSLGIKAEVSYPNVFHNTSCPAPPLQLSTAPSPLVLWSRELITVNCSTKHQIPTQHECFG